MSASDTCELFTISPEPTTGTSRTDIEPERPRSGTRLILWMALTIVLQGVLWLSCLKGREISEAVEQGAARVESRAIGEVSEDQVRKAIRTQNATLPFWTALALIGDFLVEPLSLALRALAVAILLSTAAALLGRPVRFKPALQACISVQGLWVLGLAVRVGLILYLGQNEAETSMALALPRGTNSAAAMLAARQFDAFSLLGWLAMAFGGWRRGQVNLAVAALLCGSLAVGEATLRVGVGLLIGAGMRLSFFPG